MLSCNISGYCVARSLALMWEGRWDKFSFAMFLTDRSQTSRVRNICIHVKCIETLIKLEIFQLGDYNLMFCEVFFIFCDYFAVKLGIMQDRKKMRQFVDFALYSAIAESRKTGGTDKGSGWWGDDEVRVWWISIPGRMNERAECADLVDPWHSFR